MFKNGKMEFKNATDSISTENINLWNILIVDDEQSIHDVTTLALSGFEFENKRCNFIHAHSAKEAIEILNTTPNIALALVDVVMETEHAGLDLVDHIRNVLKNKLIRIILRTGQPGQAPEEKVIHDYDINDYKSKNELTTQRLYTSVLTSLRTYRDMLSLERNRQGLKKIISSTSLIEKMSSLELFLTAVLEQLSVLLNLGEYDFEDEVSAFISAVDKDQSCIQIAGSGKYKNITPNDEYLKTKERIRPLILESMKEGHEINENGHYILFRPSNLNNDGFIVYIETDKELEEMDKDLIKLFLDNAKVAYENTMLAQEIDASQKEIIFTISEIAEQRSNETGKHVKRVALYSKLLGQAYGLDSKEVELLYSAAPMHDIGKIGIPDAILKKPGRLDDDEMEVMKTHASIGYDVLKSSKRVLLQTSAIVANEHHEKYDGTGYPNGLKGDEINIYARIVALADVFDALGSKRTYKEPWDIDKILDLIKDQSGKQFDPKLVKLFLENLDKVIEIRNTYVDDTDSYTI